MAQESSYYDIVRRSEVKEESRNVERRIGGIKKLHFIFPCFQ